MMSVNDDDKPEVLPVDLAPPEEPPEKRRQCPSCGAMADRLAAYCPECEAELQILGHAHRSGRGRRYVYGKRKTQLSQEAIWLIVVIIVGLLIVFGVQVLAFMRAKKLIMVPTMPTQMIACDTTNAPPLSGPLQSTNPPCSPFSNAHTYSTDYREVVPDDQVHQLLVVPQWREARGPHEARERMRL
ncbi:MAG: hypothetical protein ACYC63_01375 [Armatimonadota bacterium]